MLKQLLTHKNHATVSGSDMSPLDKSNEGKTIYRLAITMEFSKEDFTAILCGRLVDCFSDEEWEREAPTSEHLVIHRIREEIEGLVREHITDCGNFHNFDKYSGIVDEAMKSIFPTLE